MDKVVGYDPVMQIKDMVFASAVFHHCEARDVDPENDRLSFTWQPNLLNIRDKKSGRCSQIKVHCLAENEYAITVSIGRNGTADNLVETTASFPFHSGYGIARKVAVRALRYMTAGLYPVIS